MTPTSYKIVYKLWNFWHTFNGRDLRYREVNVLSKLNDPIRFKIFYAIYGKHMAVARDIKNICYNITLYIRKHIHIGCNGNTKCWQTKTCIWMEDKIRKYEQDQWEKHEY